MSKCQPDNENDQQIVIPDPAELITPPEGDLSYEVRKGTEKPTDSQTIKGNER
jgi:hypothetical protein